MKNTIGEYTFMDRLEIGDKFLHLNSDEEYEELTKISDNEGEDSYGNIVEIPPESIIWELE